MKNKIFLILLLALLGIPLQAQSPSNGSLESASIDSLNRKKVRALVKEDLPILTGEHNHYHAKKLLHPITEKQEEDELNWSSYPQLIKEDLLLGIGGFTNAFIQPLRWNQQDWLIFGGVAAGTFALYTVDQQSHDYMVSHKEDVPGLIREIGRAATPEHFFLLNGAVYLAGLTTKNTALRETGILLLTSASAASLMLATGKWAVGRARPETGEGKNVFDPFSSSSSWHSFPSGHALLSVTTAYAIGKKIKNPWLKAGTYTLGMIGPVSRLWEGAHWLSDVGLSIALGVAVVEGVDAYLTRKKQAKPSGHDALNWTISIGPGALGLKASF